jgi:hypothetical protein
VFLQGLWVRLLFDLVLLFFRLSVFFNSGIGALRQLPTPPMKEIISLHVGGAGTGVGVAFWEHLASERGICDPFVSGPDEAGCPDTFFQEIPAGQRYVPRAIFMDTDAFEYDFSRLGLFPKAQCTVSGKESCCMYSRGAYTAGRPIQAEAVELFRKQAECCDRLDGIMLTCGLAGGCGSGLSALMLQSLVADYPKLTTVCAPTLPDMGVSTLGSSPMDAYNCLIAMTEMRSLVSLSVVANNAGLFRALSRLSPGVPATMSSINRLFAFSLAQFVAPLHWPADPSYVSLDSLVTHIRADGAPLADLVVPSVAVGTSVDALAADIVHPSHALLDVHSRSQHAVVAEAAVSPEARDAAAARARSARWRRDRPHKAVLHAGRAVWAAGAVMCASGCSSRLCKQSMSTQVI